MGERGVTDTVECSDLLTAGQWTLTTQCQQVILTRYMYSRRFNKYIRMNYGSGTKQRIQ